MGMEIGHRTDSIIINCQVLSPKDCEKASYAIGPCNKYIKGLDRPISKAPGRPIRGIKPSTEMIIEMMMVLVKIDCFHN